MKKYENPNISIVCFHSEESMIKTVDATSSIAAMTKNSNGIKVYEIDDDGNIKLD